MAGADKTYVNKEQYLEARNFWIKTRNKQQKDLGYQIWLYPFGAFDVESSDQITDEMLASNLDLDYFDRDEFPVWNTSTKSDLWLAKNCKLKVVQERLKEQYSENWVGFLFKDQIKIKSKPYIVEIKKGKDSTYFFRKLSDNEIYTHDKIIFYGTTYLLDLINKAYEEICHLYQSKSDLEVTFDYYNIQIVHKDYGFYELTTNKQIELGYIYINEFFKPKIKHSYNTKDIKNYHLEEIYISKPDEAYDIAMYKKASKDSIRRYILELPEIYRNIIK